MSKKTVLICQKDLKGMSSGVQRKVHEEIRYFSEKGYTVFVVAEKIDKEAVKKSGGIPVKTLRWPISGYYRRLNYLRRASSFIKKFAPNLVIGHGDIVEQDICYIHNCVHLAYETIDGKPIPSDHEVGQIHSKILTEKKFKKLICNSNLMKNDLTKRFSIPIDKVQVIYPEYDPDVFKLDGSALRNQFRQENNFDEHIVLIGLITSGNFKKRNLDLLIEAVKKLAQPKLNFKVVVAGKDNINRYVSKISELELNDYFLFLPGIKAVELYYHGIDVFVLPAHIEEFGRSVLEAMGCGKPVVVSGMVGASEILEGDSREFILSDLTASELFVKLSIIIQDKSLREELGVLNYKIAQNFSKKIKYGEFNNLIKEIN